MTTTPQQVDESLDVLEDVPGPFAVYMAASDAALKAAQENATAWNRYFEGQAPEPSGESIAHVQALQVQCDMALDTARGAMRLAQPADESGVVSTGEVLVRTHRRHRSDNKFLRKIGRPGQRLLQVCLMALLIVSGLCAVAACLSLAFEVAGFLGMIEDPTQLPIGIQAGVLIAGSGLFVFTGRLLAPVERALFGRKNSRPKRLVF